MKSLIIAVLLASAGVAQATDCIAEAGIVQSMAKYRQNGVQKQLLADQLNDLNNDDKPHVVAALDMIYANDFPVGKSMAERNAISKYVADEYFKMCKERVAKH